MIFVTNDSQFWHFKVNHLDTTVRENLLGPRLMAAGPVVGAELPGRVLHAPRRQPA